MLLRRSVGGWLLLLAVSTAGLSALVGAVPKWPAGLLSWAAGILLWPDLHTASRRPIAILAAIGGLGLILGAALGQRPDWAMLLSANTALIALLVSVSFLRLISTPEPTGETALPSGPRALTATLCGVHLFGAIINLSTIFIVGDRMAASGRLSRVQALVLTRGFSTAAFWSPFFAAMAAALTYAPGARVGTLFMLGAPLAVLAMVVTYREVMRLSPNGFLGYPMRYESLWLPCLLAILVLTVHSIYPALSVVGLITLISPVLTVLVLALRGGTESRPMRRHVSARLPLMVGEVSLFLAAGVMAAGLKSVFMSLGEWLPFHHFGGIEAAATFLILTTLSVMGVHPLIGIAAAGTVLAPTVTDANLLALVFLASWALGAVINPISGLNLAFQARYDIAGTTLMRWHLPYVIKMSAAVTALLLAYGSLWAV